MFFDRRSTTRLIEELAAANPLCLYAGAGVSADIGLPLNDALAPLLLADALRKEPRLARHAPVQLEAAINRAIDGLRKASPAYLASITRESLATRGSGTSADSRLRNAIADIAAEGRRPGGFLARSIGALAFSMLQTGRSVQVVTTNYDSVVIDEAESTLHTYFPDQQDFRFAPVAWRGETDTDNDGEPFRRRAAEAQKDPMRVRLYYANGQLDSSGTLIASELDFLSPGELAPHEDQVRHRERELLLEDAMVNSICLFVGSSVTDPDTLARLARTRHVGRARYALLVAPEHRLDRSLPPDAAMERARTDHDLLRMLVERRFAHIGIVPVTVDFPAQVPQLLREVALRVKYGDGYRPYGARLLEWWNHWYEHFGFTSAGTVNNNGRSLWNQVVWREKLLALRDGPDGIRAWLGDHVTGGPTENLMVEVWVRNPRNRTVFLWASSNSLWLDGATAHHGELRMRAQHLYVAQTTFHEGVTRAVPLHSERGPWKYCVSMPLILHEEPWHHLPVGVANVLSDQTLPATADEPVGAEGSPLYRVMDGGLAPEVRKTALEGLEERIKRAINTLLDPNNLPDLRQDVLAAREGAADFA